MVAMHITLTHSARTGLKRAGKFSVVALASTLAVAAVVRAGGAIRSWVASPSSSVSTPQLAAVERPVRPQVPAQDPQESHFYEPPAPRHPGDRRRPGHH